MVQTKEGTFASVAHDGATIHTKAWLPDESAPPVAVVVWSHGVHEHLGRFERLYERFVRARIATYAWDHVGHGKSGFSGGKPHQFAAGFDAVVADAVQFAKCAFPLPLPNPAGRIHPSPVTSRRPFPPDASPTARVLLPRVAGASARNIPPRSPYSSAACLSAASSSRTRAWRPPTRGGRGWSSPRPR